MPAERPTSSYGARSWRYVLAAAGPICVAGTNFLLSFSVLRLEQPEMFGTFAFLLAAALLTIGVSNASFAAPMQALHAGRGSGRSTIMPAITSATVATVLIVGPAYALLGAALGLSAAVAACYGLFAMLTVVRSVGRAWSYAEERPWRAAVSDVCYAAGTLGAFSGIILFTHAAPGRAVYPALALGTAAAVAGLGREFARLPWRPHRAALRSYGAVWRAQSRWSLLAVAATEAVANAHIYLLTLFGGPVAVAPVAASALLVRPINVIQNALVEYERPQMARFLAAGALGEVDRSILLFRAVLLLIWSSTVAVGAAILLLQPSLVFPASYDLATIRLAASLWAVVSLVIMLQMPINVMLQAGGEFRALSRASLFAAAVGVAGVMLAIALGRPIWTIAALVPGWLASMAIVRRAAWGFRCRRLAEAGA